MEARLLLELNQGRYKGLQLSSQLLRGTKKVPITTLQSALTDVRRRYGVDADAVTAAPDDVVVAVFPRSMPVAEISRRLSAELG